MDNQVLLIIKAIAVSERRRLEVAINKLIDEESALNQRQSEIVNERNDLYGQLSDYNFVDSLPVV